MLNLTAMAWRVRWPVGADSAARARGARCAGGQRPHQIQRTVLPVFSMLPEGVIVIEKSYHAEYYKTK